MRAMVMMKWRRMRKKRKTTMLSMNHQHLPLHPSHHRLRHRHRHHRGGVAPRERRVEVQFPLRREAREQDNT